MKNRRHMNTTSDSSDRLLLNLPGGCFKIFDLAPNFDIDGEIHIDVDNIFDAVSRLNEQTKLFPSEFCLCCSENRVNLLTRGKVIWFTENVFRDAHGIKGHSSSVGRTIEWKERVDCCFRRHLLYEHFGAWIRS